MDHHLKYASLLPQSDVLNFQIAPGISSWTSRRSNETVSDTHISGSNNSSNLNSALNITSQMGNNVINHTSKSEKPELETSNAKGTVDLSNTGFNISSRAENDSFPKISDSEIQTDCELEDALVVYNGECYSLLKQGPCSSNQWLLVNEDESPYCAKRLCEEGKLFYNGSCVNISDPSVCGVAEVLYIKFSGEVYCDCLPRYYVYDTNAKQCILENNQGSCPSGQILDIDSNNKLICVNNLCKTDNHVYNPKDELCYKKNYIGSCKEVDGYSIKYYKEDQTAECFRTSDKSYLQTVTVDSCSLRSKTSQNNCRSPSGKAIATHQPSKHILCQRGFVKSGGACVTKSSLIG